MSEIDMHPWEEAFELPAYTDANHSSESDDFDLDDAMLLSLHNLKHEQQKEIIGDVFKNRATALFYDALTEIFLEHPGLELKNRADAIIIRNLMHERFGQLEIDPEVDLFKGRHINLTGVDILSYGISQSIAAPSAFPRSVLPDIPLEATTAGIEFGPSYIRNGEGRPTIGKLMSPLLAIHTVWARHNSMPIQLAGSTELLYVPLDQQAVTIRPTMAFVESKK